MEQDPRPHRGGPKAHQRSGVIAGQKADIKALVQIQPHHGVEQQAWNGERLGKPHQGIDMGRVECPQPYRQVSRHQHRKHRCNDPNDHLHRVLGVHKRQHTA